MGKRMVDPQTRHQAKHQTKPGRTVRARLRGAAQVAVVLGGALGLWAGNGCQNRSGMPCQQQSDCNTGLLCNKPPAAGPQGYGICEPGLRGLGEICVSSAECSPGLVCSTVLGQPSEDGWHGMCQAGALADAAAGDLTAPADLGTAADLVGADGSLDL
jgi:hypothetical protein